MPVLAAAAVVMALTYLCSLYLMPLGQRVMKDKVLDIRADIGAAMLNEGQFNTPAKGLTVFIRELVVGRRISAAFWCTTTATRSIRSPIWRKSGLLAQTPAGARLIMLNGTIQQSAKQRRPALGAEVPALRLRPRPVRQPRSGEAPRETSERYLPELFWPDLEQRSRARPRTIYSRRSA